MIHALANWWSELSWSDAGAIVLAVLVGLALYRPRKPKPVRIFVSNSEVKRYCITPSFNMRDYKPRSK
jgi:hypothetical protein